MEFLNVLDVAKRATSLFRRAAREWERGNNSGDPQTLAKCEARCEALRREGELLVVPFGVTVSYPGLYPLFTVGNHRGGIDDLEHVLLMCQEAR